MDSQERIRILELAFDLVEYKSPQRTGMEPEAGIREWAKLFDQAYKAIKKTVQEQGPTDLPTTSQ